MTTVNDNTRTREKSAKNCEWTECESRCEHMYMYSQWTTSTHNDDAEWRTKIDSLTPLTLSSDLLKRTKHYDLRNSFMYIGQSTLWGIQNCTILFFAITLSYLSLFEYLLVHIYRDKFGTNWHQNHQCHSKGVFILLCEMQHTYTCYDQRRFSHVGLNVITIVLNI